MELYIFKIQDEPNTYVKVSTKTFGCRRTKNINDASWWFTKKNAKSWDSSIKEKFPSAEIIPVDMSFSEVKFQSIKG
jgi:hypothetical protein